jgi:putative membrane protein
MMKMASGLRRAASGWRRLPRAARCSLLAASFAMPAFAHAENHHLRTAEVLRWWSWEPITIALLAITAVLYTLGSVRIWSAAVCRRSIAFTIGWLALVIALLSPLDNLGEILFSAHMAQHEMLMIVAAPLIVLGRPLIAFLWALPANWRTTIGHWAQSAPVARSWHFLTAPLVATILHAIALWIWHLPSWYEATLRSDFIHALQHTSFLLTAALFWWAMIHGRYGRIGYGVAVMYVFITAAHSGALGALIAFSPHVLYPIYQSRTALWGLDPIEDQQLAGIIMWIPAGVLMTILAVALFAAWLGEAERRVKLTQSELLRKGPPTMLLLLLLACNREQKLQAMSSTGGDPSRGKEAIERYGCQACHNIPGLPGPKGMVGPTLAHMASRAYIGGKLPNNPQTMIKWLQNPAAFDPQSAMPNLAVTESDSRDITAYLYTLK